MAIGHRHDSARAACAASALLLCAGAALAQAPTPPPTTPSTSPPTPVPAAVDADVDAVVQGGRWSETGVGDGRYRVVVVTRGFDHVSSRLVAEWKADGDGSGAAKIVHTAELVAAGSYSLGTPTLTADKTGVRVDVDGTPTHAPDTRVHCRFALAPGGKVSVVRACGD